MPGSAPRPTFDLSGKNRPRIKPKLSPGGGPLDAAARDQALLDLAEGRMVDLSMGPGGSVSRDFSGPGMSAGTAAALVLSGVAALGLVAFALRRKKS